MIDPRTIVLAWQRFGQGEKVGGPDEKKEDPQTEVQQTHSSKVDVFDIHIPFSALAASIVTAEDQFLNREHSHSSSITTNDIQNGNANSKPLGDSFSKTSNIQRVLILGRNATKWKVCRNIVTTSFQMASHELG